MPGRHEIGHLRQLLTSGVDLMTQMPVTAEWLRRLVPAFSLSMIRVDERCAPAQHYSEYFDAASHDLFMAHGHEFAGSPDDPAAFATLLHNPSPIGSLIHTAPEFVAGATYQHLFKRNGIHHVLDIAIRNEGEPLGILGIFREQGALPFTRADLVPMLELYPYLVHVFRAEPVPADFDEVDSALIVTSAAGAVSWASPGARRWLDDRALGVAAACDALCRRLAALQAGRGDDEGPPTLALPVPGGRLRLRAYGLAPEAGAVLSDHCGIQLSLEMHRGLQALRALELLPLTPQQRRVAFAYFQGLEAPQVCARLGVSASSLKTYRRELYARLEVSSRTGLVELLNRHARATSVDLTRHLPRPGTEPVAAHSSQAPASRRTTSV